MASDRPMAGLEIERRRHTHQSQAVAELDRRRDLSFVSRAVGREEVRALLLLSFLLSPDEDEKEEEEDEEGAPAFFFCCSHTFPSFSSSPRDD